MILHKLDLKTEKLHVNPMYAWFLSLTIACTTLGAELHI